jgi:hypothetical protein
MFHFETRLIGLWNPTLQQPARRGCGVRPSRLPPVCHPRPQIVNQLVLFRSVLDAQIQRRLLLAGLELGLGDGNEIGAAPPSRHDFIGDAVVGNSGTGFSIRSAMTQPGSLETSVSAQHYRMACVARHFGNCEHPKNA